jgi:hypothetical protein
MKYEVKMANLREQRALRKKGEAKGNYTSSQAEREVQDVIDKAKKMLLAEDEYDD